MKSYRRKRPEQYIDEKNVSTLSKIALNPAFILTCVTAILYFHGQAYHSGRLSYWGLTNQIFPLNFEDTLSTGAIGYLFLGIEHWEIFLYFLLILIAPYVIAYLLLCDKPRNLILHLSNKERINPGHQMILEEGSNKLLLTITTTGIIALLLLTAPIIFYKGKATSHDFHQRIRTSDKESETSRVVTINYIDHNNHPITISGIIIAASANMLAILKENDQMVMIHQSKLLSTQQDRPLAKSEKDK